MFINVSNHPSANWGAEQRIAAQQWGEIVDFAFPHVAPEADTKAVTALAETYYVRISEMIPSGSAEAAIMVSGEFTFTYHLVTLLLQAGYRVVSACTRREAEEQTLPDGSSIKTARFTFVQFREY